MRLPKKQVENSGGGTYVITSTSGPGQEGSAADSIVNTVNAAGASNAGNYKGTFSGAIQTNNGNARKNNVNAALNAANTQKK